MSITVDSFTADRAALKQALKRANIKQQQIRRLLASATHGVKRRLTPEQENAARSAMAYSGFQGLLDERQRVSPATFAQDLAADRIKHQVTDRHHTVALWTDYTALQTAIDGVVTAIANHAADPGSVDAASEAATVDAAIAAVTSVS